MFIKKSHPDSVPESLEVPVCSDMKLYDLDNWSFSQVMDSGFDPNNGTVGRIVGECKLTGYERLKFEWTLTQKDIDVLGHGSENGFRSYVIESFGNALQIKKEDYLRKIGGIILAKK